MKPPVTTRKLTTLSLLAAIALALYAVESALPPIVPIPGIKLGLSNIITLVVLWKYSAKDASAMAASRESVVSFLVVTGGFIKISVFS